MTSSPSPNRNAARRRRRRARRRHRAARCARRPARRAPRYRRGVAERHGSSADRTAPPTSPVIDRRVEPERGVDRVGVRLVEIGRRRRSTNSTTAGVTSPGAARSATRAASTPIDVESSSYDATARVPFPPPRPSVRRDRRSLQAPVRHVGAIATIPRATSSPLCLTARSRARYVRREGPFKGRSRRDYGCRAALAPAPARHRGACSTTRGARLGVVQREPRAPLEVGDECRAELGVVR